MRDTGIADRLRQFGVPVVEVDGWQSRGSDSFSPAGAVWHHTAGSTNGSTPSLGVVINGRPDLPGPLCHVLQSRETSGPDVAYVIAAGRANHAGDGGWHGLSGNSSVYGLEVEHTGTSELPRARQETAQRIVAALVSGRAGADRCCQHSEWAPSRKIDIATGTNPDSYRAATADLLAGGGGGGGTDPGGFDLSAEQYEQIMARLDEVEHAVNWSRPGTLVRSPSGGYWLIGAAGRWPVLTSGSMAPHEIAQWLSLLGVIPTADPVESNVDYIEALPDLRNVATE